VSGQFDAPAALPSGKEPSDTHRIGGCLDAVEKRKTLAGILTAAFQPVAILSAVRLVFESRQG
jgi:hypothetical protein